MWFGIYFGEKEKGYPRKISFVMDNFDAFNMKYLSDQALSCRLFIYDDLFRTLSGQIYHAQDKTSTPEFKVLTPMQESQRKPITIMQKKQTWNTIN